MPTPLCYRFMADIKKPDQADFSYLKDYFEQLITKYLVGQTDLHSQMPSLVISKPLLRDGCPAESLKLFLQDEINENGSQINFREFLNQRLKREELFKQDMDR